MAERLNAYQSIISSWKERLKPTDTSIEREYTRLQQENKELGQAVEQNNNAHIAEEAGDMIIGLLQIIHLSGHDAENILNTKLDVMHRKYNHVDHLNLREQGHAPESAMAKQKTIWEASGQK